MSRDFNLGDVAALWAVESSTFSGSSRLQDRAKERIQHRACPSFTTFEEYAKVRTSCYILEERNGDFYCDCYEGCKGKLCKHSVGMDYFVGNLIVEDDVRAVPLGGKRKRGCPKRNPHCLTRSPCQSSTADNVQAGDDFIAEDVQEGLAGDDIIAEDVQEGLYFDASQPLPDSLPVGVDVDAQLGSEVEVMPANADSHGMEDFCLQLEDSCSSSDNDMSIIGSNPDYQYKPPKKPKRDVTEVLLACRGRSRGSLKDTTGGNGRIVTSPSGQDNSRLSPTRRGRGKPRGRVGRVKAGGRGSGRGNITSSQSAVGDEEGRGRIVTSPSSQGDSRLSPTRRGRGRPRGRVGRAMAGGRGRCRDLASSQSPMGDEEERAGSPKKRRWRPRKV